MESLHNKVAVVTGGGSGIGRALCLKLAAAGVKLAVADLNAGSAAMTARMVADAGGSATAHEVDVSSESDMRDLVKSVLDAHEVVDILVNNAGVAVEPGSTGDYSLETFRRVVDINLMGAVNGTVLFLPSLLTRPQAHIVNVCSYAGLLGLPTMAAYSTSKFGMRGFTEALQLEFAGTSVAVTLVLPGATGTNLMSNSLTIDEEKRQRYQQVFDGTRTVSAERVAELVLRGIERDRPRVLTGADTKAIDFLVRRAPNRYPRLLHRALKRTLKQRLG